MNGTCDEFDRVLEGGEAEGEEQARWREHLATCAVCSEQESVDALLRKTMVGPAPELEAGFESRLQQRLERQVADRPPATGRPQRLRPSSWWTLGAYANAATFASVLVLSRLPWQSFTAPPALGIALGALALLSPLVLVDRIGIVRPPG